MSFDRRTEARIPEAGLQRIEVHFVVDERIKLISARPDGCDAANCDTDIVCLPQFAAFAQGH